jgi:hypothetical protein
MPGKVAALQPMLAPGTLVVKCASHADLIVRICGYSDYFNRLGRDLQLTILERPEHGRAV